MNDGCFACCATWAPPSGPPTLAEAIETVEHSRATHTEWADRPDHEGHGHECQECRAAGNPAHHRGVIARYDRAIEAMRQTAAR